MPRPPLRPKARVPRPGVARPGVGTRPRRAAGGLVPPAGGRVKRVPRRRFARP